MAIATAGLLGYRLCANFNAPYLALDITDFWRRWHISLSSWLKDYLYISLGGNRGGRIFTYRNLMLTMVLGGLWHGASWNFVLWGFMHGLALIVHKVWSKRGIDLGSHPALKPVAWALTLGWVVAAWVPFRATTFGDTVTTLKLLTGQATDGARTLLGSGAALLWLVIGALLLGHWITHGTKLWSERWRLVSPEAYGFGYGVAWAVVIALKSTNYAPFIYFQF